MKQIKGVWLPDSDTHFERHLLKGPTYNNHGTYQFEKLMEAVKLTGSRHTAIDIGAHVGLWSMVLKDYFEHIASFEPVPAHLLCFHANLKGAIDYGQGEGNVEIHPFALGNREKKIFINPTPDNTGNAHVETMKSETTIEVQQYRLDDCVEDFMIPPPISFIKIDVEGYELEVVRGGERTIKAHKPVIVIEQKPGNATKYGFRNTEALELLIKWGAKVKWVKNGDYCLSFN